MRGAGRSVRSGGMDDEALVARQLGRTPRAFRRVAVRCPWGRPAVTEQWPRDASGEPFPTTFYVTCPHLVAAIARLEAAGADGGASLQYGIAGSRRGGSLKCLHAHAAFALARPGYELGEGIVAEVGSPWPVSGCCTAE